MNRMGRGLKRGWKCTLAAFRAGPLVGATRHSRVPAGRKGLHWLGIPEIYGGNGEVVNSSVMKKKGLDEGGLRVTAGKKNKCPHLFFTTYSFNSRSFGLLSPLSL